MAAGAGAAGRRLSIPVGMAFIYMLVFTAIHCPPWLKRSKKEALRL
jgi:hypothetical protein